ncbi:hypothetical protein GobsT_09650 [Gemmata obscuriglobus]|uniref:Uncharacterized protein n=1 Tax=Gemmata obscuriglobus TaxID=114 RepID=A0A2Z3HA62_9BACT|nr:hypothetical protein [Gemmata obscuriglobus]AWM40526.1 hypothetical protein C1280_28435 [Gemmata obscuriglobus]QEG26226.1 hypothetical protein GobsT_09650 [Gemmata obscuriglobus]VTS00967.1 unnamed protein product [Gemmata obscuriglobus UQM 2246]
MKVIPLLVVFAAGAVIGWGARTNDPKLDGTGPKEMLVQHPDPDRVGLSMWTQVRLCRVGDTDLEAIPSSTTPKEYWVITLGGVRYCGVGHETKRLVNVP